MRTTLAIVSRGAVFLRGMPDPLSWSAAQRLGLDLLQAADQAKAYEEFERGEVPEPRPRPSVERRRQRAIADAARTNRPH